MTFFLCEMRRDLMEKALVGLFCENYGLTSRAGHALLRSRTNSGFLIKSRRLSRSETKLGEVPCGGSSFLTSLLYLRNSSLNLAGTRTDLFKQILKTRLRRDLVISRRGDSSLITRMIPAAGSCESCRTELRRM